jgi:hypothetical protein
MVLWAAAHEETENPGLVRQIKMDKKQFLAAARRRWTESVRNDRRMLEVTKEDERVSRENRAGDIKSLV